MYDPFDGGGRHDRARLKRLAFALIALVILSAVGSVWLFGQLLWLTVQVAFAAEQTEIFEDMRARAVQSGPVEAAECLGYAVHYYPSGTKQVVGSRLDRMVERQRASAVSSIIAHLRSKTGQDLGDDPEAWIEKFARNKAAKTTEPAAPPDGGR